MSTIKFSKQETAEMVTHIQDYFSDKLDQDIGQFDAEFLLDFFSEKMGTHYYNQGLRDAQAALENKLEDIADVIYSLEK